MKMPALFSRVASLFSTRSWRQAWACGDDTTLGDGVSASLHEAARQSAWVFRCLQLIAGPIRSVPLEWYQLAGRNEQVELDDMELAQFWARPAETAGGIRLSFGDFIELSCHWIGLKGQACWILDDSWLSPRGIKSPIILARADRLTAITRGNALIGWQFQDGMGRGYSLLPQQVIRPRFLNPYDDTEGLAPLDAAWIAASADHAAGLFARNVAQANGDQGVYVISKGGVLTQEQQQQMIAQLRQKAALSRRGEFKAAFLTGDVTIEDPKVRSVDAAFLRGRNFCRDEIAVAFGVPASMLQVMQSYSIGSASDRFRLIDETCVPMGMRLAEAIAEVERLRTGRVLAPEFDWSEHSVMAQVRNEKLKAAADVWKTGVPWDVLNDAMDLGLDGFAGSDRAWLPMGLEAVPAGGGNDETRITNDESSPKLEDSTIEPEKLMRSNMKTLDGLIVSLEKMAGEGSKFHVSGSKLDAPDSKLETRNSKPSVWKTHQAARKPSEKLMLAKIRKVLMEARRETLSRLEASEAKFAGVKQRGVLDILFDLTQFTVSLVSETAKAMRETLSTATGQLLLEIGREDDPWTMPDDQVIMYLRRRENRMKDVARSVYEDIQAAIQEGLDAGESMPKLAARVRGAFNEASDVRAMTIATTETGAAYGAARDAGMQGLGITHKQWITADDGERVRRTHRAVHEKIVRIDEPFEVQRDSDGGIDYMQHPCDEGGSAENCINCRCIHVPVMDAAE